MVKIKIKGKNYELPTSWDEITMKQYCHLFYNLPTVDSKASDGEKFVQEIDNEAIIISRLLGQKDDFVMNLPFELFITLQEKVKFIYNINDFLDSGMFSLNIDGRKYWMVEPKDMSLRHFIDSDMIMKQDENEGQFIELLACLLLPKDVEYDGKYQALIPKIENMSARDCLPFIYTFFKKKELSNRASEVYSKVEEAADRLLHSTQGS